MRNIIFLFTIIFYGCSNQVILEKSEGSLRSKSVDATIILIDPDARVYVDDKIDSQKSLDLQLVVSEAVLLVVEKQKLNVDVQILGKNKTHYLDLLALKQEMLSANNFQDTPLNFNNDKLSSKYVKRVFIYPPLISHEYSRLQRIFNTPYYSHISVFRNDGVFYLYHLVVNTSTSETVYREVKKVKTLKLDKWTVYQMVYDSFVTLNTEM